MAEKGWTARVTAAAGAAAGIGAAQLGLGYGLGVVVWPVTETPDQSVWLGSLGWATWITASATVFGAVIASRLGGGPAASSRGPWRLALATSAAAGALVAVALIALPARSAVRADTFSPQVIAGGYAMIGVVIGLVVAYWAVVSRPVAANLITTAVWLWALAISAIVVELAMHRGSATYLTSWQFAEPGTDHRYGTIFWPSAALTLAVAFLIGLFAVIPAARRGSLGLGAATSGAVGPLLVAASFFALAPQLTGTLGPLESAYLIAPYAVLAGLAGSALTVAMAQAAVNRRARKAARRAALSDTADLAAAEPADIPALTASEAGPAQASPQTRHKPTASAGRASVGDADAEAAASAEGPRPSATPAPRKATPGSTRPAPAAPAGPVRPWEAAPDVKSSDSSASGAARSGAATTTAGRSRSGKPQPATDQAGPGTTRPDAARSGPAEPGAPRPGTAKSGTAQPGAAQPAPARPATAQPDQAGIGQAPTGPAQPGKAGNDRPPVSEAQAARPGNDRPQAAGAQTGRPASESGQNLASDQPKGGPALDAQGGSGSARTGPATARPGAAVGAEADGEFDSEIAAAARPRGRAKKAAPPPRSPDSIGEKAPKSTVTPPPSAPTIAQINPKPRRAD